MQREIREPLALFYVYAREDELFRDQLDKHLSGIARQGLISSWHDRQIVAGTVWKQEFDGHLETASIISAW